jgi:hypothetical protein
MTILYDNKRQMNGQGDFWVLTFFLCILIAMKKYVFIDKVKYELMI